MQQIEGASGCFASGTPTRALPLTRWEACSSPRPPAVNCSTILLCNSLIITGLDPPLGTIWKMAVFKLLRSQISQISQNEKKLYRTNIRRHQEMSRKTFRLTHKVWCVQGTLKIFTQSFESLTWKQREKMSKLEVALKLYAGAIKQKR